MPSLNDLARARTALSEQDLEWLHLLLADWQLVADLSFADLILWLPLRDGSGFVAAAQMRPTTGPTVHHDDVVGREVRRGLRWQLDTAFDERRIVGDRDPDYVSDVPVREETIPVVRAGTAIAVVSRHTNLAAARTPSRLELTYLRTADDLARMICQGRFPVIGPGDQIERSPRVGDGLIRIDDQGVVSYASPNALSAFRRLGLSADLGGHHLGDVTAQLSGAGGHAVDETLSAVVSGASPHQLEVEAAGATVRIRVIPLVDQVVRVGALVLCRDVTEVRRRERELVSKDATIREIHHRVKNNLHTVASLLRLQARRLDSEPARHALEEAERRVASIALVHETLAQTLDAVVGFDEVADRVTEMVAGGLDRGAPVRVHRKGRFGELPPEIASALSLVLVELLQNAVEHGLRDAGGTVTVEAHRNGNELVLVVEDDGVGLPEGLDLPSVAGRGLGLQIVRTLVETELGGEISLVAGSAAQPRPGCVATVQLTG